VTSSAGLPTGTVNFNSGALAIGTSSLAGGIATIATAALTAGVHTLTAVYAGNANFNGAGSDSVEVTVDKANSAVEITSASPEASTVGQAVHINFSVSAAPPGS